LFALGEFNQGRRYSGGGVGEGSKNVEENMNL